METLFMNDAPDFRTQPRAFLESLFMAAVRSAQPLHGMRSCLPSLPVGRTVVVGAGKAAGSMAHALEALWPLQAPLSGLVVTRYGHIPPRPAGLTQRIEVMEAAHPVPDSAGCTAAQRMLDMVHGLTADDLVLCLISGGGSALLSLPVEGLSLHEKQRITRALLESGASIGEMNCVRKHLSRIKGGRLALACGRARVATLAISDVPGDDVSTIASGPTVPDATTCSQAADILLRYGIRLPPQVHQALQAGHLETPKPGNALFADHGVHIVATPWRALEAAASVARAAGLPAYILSDSIEGEARDVGKVHAALAQCVAQHGQPFATPCVVLSGGETTVAMRPRLDGAACGHGGRAGEFCLGLAQALQGHAQIWALAADTDGIDGSQDNAGAWVCPDTLLRAERKGLRIDDHLARNDAWAYFAALGDLLVTGPTWTNVNDFRAMLVA